MQISFGGYPIYGLFGEKKIILGSYFPCGLDGYKFLLVEKVSQKENSRDYSTAAPTVHHAS